MAEMGSSSPQTRRGGASGARDWVLTALIAITFLLGGGSRYDIVSLLILRPVSAVALAYALYRWPSSDGRGFKAPIVLLCCWIALVTLQLVPLPPGVWTALPGREAVVASFAATGTALGWQPLTVVPFATINSLLALMLPLAVLLLYAESSAAERQRAVYAVCLLALASALFGIAQFVGGSSGSLYPYAISNKGMPIGFFANRNHQAAVLAAVIPLILAASANRASAANTAVMWAGRALALGLVMVAVMTGSRSGTALALIALVAGSLLLVPARPDRSSAPQAAGARFGQARALASRWAVPAILAATVAVVFVIANGTAFERLANKDELGDLRFQILPAVFAAIRSSLPFGYGFGTFPWVYNIFEPVDLMQATYVNRAHDDWLELLLEGGVFAPAIALACGTWFVARCWRLRRALASPARANDRLRLAGAMGIAALAAASLFDYPLRTPSAAAILMVLIGCLATPRRT